MTGPPKPLGMSDVVALEAAEYLERLDTLLATGDSSSADELVRLARALRGSALMANQHAIARTAAALEALARAVREGRRAWDPQTRQLAVRGVDDLKIFVRRAPAWSDAATAKAEALSQELEQLAGRPSAQVRAAAALGLDAGARDRKSTRLNSSHSQISYAVFCLKKKKEFDCLITTRNNTHTISSLSKLSPQTHNLQPCPICHKLYQHTIIHLTLSAV